MGEQITRSELEAVAERASEQAIEKLLLRLGVDPSVPEEVTAFRDRLLFLKRMERGINSVSNTIVTALLKYCAIAAVAGLIVLLTLGVKAWIDSTFFHVTPPH